MKKWIFASLMALCSAAPSVAQEMPAKAQACVACHGQNGVSGNPEWPNLAGQHEAYLAIQITSFRDGTRDNPVMAPFVADLTDADISALANYYASQPGVTAANGDPALVSSGENLAAYCKACHGTQGVPAANEWPIIAGQHAQYLQKQLAAYKSGARVNPHMQAVIAHLGEEQFKALAAYYSQLSP